LDIATAEFVLHDGYIPIVDSPFGFPVVKKAARGGYNAVQILTSRAEAWINVYSI